MTTRILTGDCRDILAAMPAESVDCVVTSPPYWGLRSYLPNGHVDKPRELGCEPTLGEHIATMVAVFDEVRRVLKPTGTLWLNYGDSYVGGGGFWANAPSNVAGSKQTTQGGSKQGGIKPENGLKPKDLCMVPNRLAIALQEAGWWVRSEIIWHKPNPMPESVRDRPTSAHEKVWLLTKSERYFYDAEAIAEPGSANSHGALNGDPGNKARMIGNHSGPLGLVPESGTRNRRNVWTIPSQPFSDAHFATFPPALVEPCVLAGCPQKVCAKCGKPWVRRTRVSYTEAGRGNNNMTRKGADFHGTGSARPYEVRMLKDTETLGFRPSCHCKAGTQPGTVLDPFGGSGTVGMVADRLGRDAVLIELNPAYAAMAQSRIVNDLPLFAEVFS